MLADQPPTCAVLLTQLLMPAFYRKPTRSPNTRLSVVAHALNPSHCPAYPVVVWRHTIAGSKTQLHLFKWFRLQNNPGLQQPSNLLTYYQGAEDSRRLMQATGRVKLVRGSGLPLFIPQSVLRQVHSLFRSEFSTDCEPVLPLSVSRFRLSP